MDVKMEDRLPRDTAVVREHVEPLKREGLDKRTGNNLCCAHDIVQVLFREGQKIDAVDFRDDQGVPVVDGADVQEGDRAVVLEQDLCRRFVSNDSAKHTAVGAFIQDILHHETRER